MGACSQAYPEMAGQASFTPLRALLHSSEGGRMRNLNGTAQHASASTHLGIERSRRDKTRACVRVGYVVMCGLER